MFVLDRHGQPIMPTHPARARKLLEAGRARVHKRTPFTIRLVDRVLAESIVQPIRLKVDPGSKTTGMCLVREETKSDGAIVHHVLFHLDLHHRGKAIRKKMSQRTGYRRRRRTANLRYRKPRFANRTRPTGWLPPSLQSRVDNVLGWTGRLRGLVPITAATVERVRFDMQALVNPEISGVEYQQGELLGYEVREYLLEKWGRACAYCGEEHVPLQVEHIVAKARGGSDRVSNLTLACGPCNQRKGARSIEDFLSSSPDVLKRVLAWAKAPLRDAAAVNATRNAVFFGLRATGLPVESATGGRTKWNRSRLGVPKAHCLDAACTGIVDDVLGWSRPVLSVTAAGRGAYQRTRVDASGFPRGYLMRTKSVKGFRTGDMVTASVPTGKKGGVHVGRVAVRATGYFNIQTTDGVVQGVAAKRCCLLSRADGYGYACLQAPVLQDRRVSDAD